MNSAKVPNAGTAASQSLTEQLASTKPEHFPTTSQDITPHFSSQTDQDAVAILRRDQGPQVDTSMHRIPTNTLAGAHWSHHRHLPRCDSLVRSASLDIRHCLSWKFEEIKRLTGLCSGYLPLIVYLGYTRSNPRPSLIRFVLGSSKVLPERTADQCRLFSPLAN